MSGSKEQLPGRWTRRQRDWGVAIWMAFLSACVGTFVLFAVVDAERLTDVWTLDWDIGIRLVYGLGFFFLFVISLLASLLTEYMIRTGPHRGHASGKGKRPPPEIHDPADGNPDLQDEQWR